MTRLEVHRHASAGVTFLGAKAPGGVAFAFTERTGGVSEGPFASLNLGASSGDDPACVAENRARALAVVGAGSLGERLVSPRQIHGDHLVLVRTEADAARARLEAGAGADGVVCLAPGVPVLLLFADCVPVVLTAPGGFAVAHSGWRGTLAGIAGKAARALAEASGAAASDVCAAIGPHIGAADYEVSAELAEDFRGAFGPEAAPDGRHLDLGLCVTRSLVEAGVPASGIWRSDVSTARATDRFFSHRASGGSCGRHGAVAVMGAGDVSWERVS